MFSICLQTILLSFSDSSTPHVDESDLEYRARVEQIRQLGGDKWLTMLGEIKAEDKLNTKGSFTPEGSFTDRLESPSSETSKTFVAKVAGIEPGETGTRLHFGFTCELEELVRSKLDADCNM